MGDVWWPFLRAYAWRRFAGRIAFELAFFAGAFSAGKDFVPLLADGIHWLGQHPDVEAFFAVVYVIVRFVSVDFLVAEQMDRLEGPAASVPPAPPPGSDDAPELPLGDSS